MWIPLVHAFSYQTAHQSRAGKGNMKGIIILLIPLAIYLEDKRQQAKAKEKRAKMKRQARKLIWENNEVELEEMLRVVDSLEK